MADLSGKTLVLVIQALASQEQILEAKLRDAGEDDDVRDDEELLLAYSQASEEVRRAYEQERAKYSNLPAYESLVSARRT